VTPVFDLLEKKAEDVGYDLGSIVFAWVVTVFYFCFKRLLGFFHFAAQDELHLNWSNNAIRHI
jgi:hypothetical protein